MLRGLVVMFFAGCAFVMGLIFVRLLRKSITEEGEVSGGAKPSLETLPMHVYNTVIQQLKQQKQELQVQSQTEQQRARVGEVFNQAVLSNLPCGVLVFGTNGLIKSSNPAAKEILGFASTTGMNAEDIFRGALIRSKKTSSTADSTEEAPEQDVPEESIGLADEVQFVLRDGGKRRQVEGDYETPAGERRFLAMTVSPVPAGDGNLLGAACLIQDLSELESLRQQQELHGEISAEKALQLRTSLATISGYAQQLANHHDAELAKQLAIDIAQEAAQLDQSVGGFLTTKDAAKAAAAGSSANG
jgi:PAS domain-containing protein